MATLGLSLATALAPHAVLAQEAWPPRKINFVVALGPGGSADRTARALAQRMQEELGVPITVINQEGGGGHVGHTYFTQMPADGSYFLATSLHPYIGNAILEFDADYKMDDFAFINSQWNDYDLFAVNADTPYETLAEFMEAAREDPGKLRISLVSGSSAEVNLDLALQAFGLDRSAVNVVTYESGGAARTAVAGGQVEMNISAAEGNLPIAEYLRPLAIAAEEPSEDWDAPTLNQTLKVAGLEEVPVFSGGMRGLAAHAAFKESNPEAFEKLVQAYKTILEDPEFVAMLESQDIGTEWLGPEETTAMINSNFEILQEFNTEN
ncbi:MAG: tripartite tricarboxylate transporter substrate binding protein [Paracoccus denitrificans]|uniref:Tripartite tricarboxylate transporter substrate binding protein n=1 Tax=Paracoccus denitrificans TaxID=266 RepID=A0A533I318_PARDE|nr:MAG: tripartite tricarboxylate transporter substrate binding protein [Paracoccus denitrificans]